MADETAKRIAEFIEPLRVKPGAKVTLAKDFDPGYKAGVRQEEGRPRAPAAGRRAAERVPGAPRRAGHLRRPRRAAGARRRRQGRHHPPRHERREPAGRLGALLQGAVRRGAQPRLPVALRQEPARPRRDRHLQPLLLRGGPGGARAPREPPAPAAAEAGARPGRLEAALPRHQRLGALPHRQGLHASSSCFLNLSQEEQRIRFLRRIDLPDHNWKFSAADAKERSYWDDYQKAFSEMLSATSTEWAPWYVIPADHKWFARICAVGRHRQRADRDRPALPQGDARGARGAPGDQGRSSRPQAPEGAAPDPFASRGRLAAKKAKTGRAARRPQEEGQQEGQGSSK